MPEKEQTQIIRKFDLKQPLTKREREVMNLLIQGMTYKAIAASLHVTEKTVGSHASNIYIKADVMNRVELMNLLMNQSNSPSELE